MNVLFIYSLKDAFSPDKPLLTRADIPFGISYISSFLKKEGHDTELAVLTKKTRFIAIDRIIKKTSPRLICFTAVFSEYAFITDAAKYIKKRYPGIFQLIGGPHVSLNPESCIAAPFDAICVGEGEEATLELVKQLEGNIAPSGISNLWIRKGGNFEKNITRPFLKKIDILPYPDTSLWDRWIEKPKEFFTVLLGRGCPFLCAYCCNHALRKIASGDYVRLRSADNIIQEIRDTILVNRDVKKIYLEVETFGLDIEWAKKLCAKLEELNRELIEPLSFGTNLRITPGIDAEDLLSTMKKCGFDFINIGLESGNENIRRGVLKRNYSNEDIFRAVRSAKKYGIRVIFYILMGIPGETAEDFKDTIRVSRICQPDHYMLSIFFPYPGTELYKSAEERGLIKRPLDIRNERARAALDMPEFTKRQIISNYIWFEYNVYKGLKPLYKILDTVFTLKIKSIPVFFYILNIVLGNKMMRSLKESWKKAVHRSFVFMLTV
ncbi:MAG: radical SAM protein [Candidatus Omnitrophota bacterium]|jgi:radical SAM superfamily enzyme YgiQ (UPF0313 family)